MNIAIFGGSFDPIHNGHLGIVKKSLKQFKINKLIIIPTYISNFKTSYRIHPEIKFRITKSIFAKYKNIFVSDFEKNQQRKVSTYESVLFVRKKFKTRKIYVIIGADNMQNIKKWDNYKKLNSIVRFIVAPRGKIKINKNKYTILNYKNNNSSSQIYKNNSLKNIPIKAKLVLQKCQGKLWIKE